jgi:hypothetical protein
MNKEILETIYFDNGQQLAITVKTVKLHELDFSKRLFIGTYPNQILVNLSKVSFIKIEEKNE